MALAVGNSSQGWALNLSEPLLFLRLPRMLVAFLAGMALALAGTVIQRITNNGMASPEVMGISAGGAFAVVMAALLGFTFARTEQMLLGAAGAFFVLVIIGFSVRRKQFSPVHMLLVGIGVNACFDALTRIALSSGQETVKPLLTWLSGSTYLVTHTDAVMLSLGLVTAGVVLLFTQRWLNIIALGDTVSSALGVACGRVRQIMMLLAALLTAMATVIVGPLSFVGLLAPHMAKSLGQYTAGHQLIVSALVGGNIMMLADWVGGA